MLMRCNLDQLVNSNIHHSKKEQLVCGGSAILFNNISCLSRQPALASTSSISPLDTPSGINPANTMSTWQTKLINKSVNLWFQFNFPLKMSCFSKAFYLFPGQILRVLLQPGTFGKVLYGSYTMEMLFTTPVNSRTNLWHDLAKGDDLVHSAQGSSLAQILARQLMPLICQQDSKSLPLCLVD